MLTVLTRIWHWFFPVRDATPQPEFDFTAYHAVLRDRWVPDDGNYDNWYLRREQDAVAAGMRAFRIDKPE